MWARLVRDKSHAQHALGFLSHLIKGANDLHAAAFAPSTRVNLGFDHPHRPAKLLGRTNAFIDAEGGDAARNRCAEVAQIFLGLVFVYVHAGPTVEGRAQYQPDLSPQASVGSAAC